jgi:hypothetical protein
MTTITMLATRTTDFANQGFMAGKSYSLSSGRLGNLHSIWQSKYATIPAPSMITWDAPIVKTAGIVLIMPMLRKAQEI